LQPPDNKALSRGIIGKSAPILAEITIRKSQEDVLVIYNALKNYKPGNEDEEMTYEMLIEQFEEMLVVDYKVKLPGVRW
jgi:hypothetical protein